jgi:putative ABC transport system ATP-binding protein
MTNTAPTTAEGPGGPAADGVAARAEAISKVYGSGDAKVIALNDVTIGIPRGRFTAIMGPSGSGKSTLMHCMAGLDTVDAGRGDRVRSDDRAGARSHGLGTGAVDEGLGGQCVRS